MTFNLNEAVDKRVKKQTLVEEVLSDLLGLKVVKEAVKKQLSAINIKAFPELRPEDKQELEVFLKNIQGNDLKSKVTNINSFFSKFMQEGFNPEDPSLFEDKSNSQALQETISYLVFYKSLTALIAKLSPSSAGFSFEHFLSVLIGGNVLPANQGNAAKTLVDIVGSNEGDISAKLLTKDKPKITGAYSNLINDMINGKQLKYIIGLKEFEDQKAGEGKLSFGEFLITRDNFISILEVASPSALEGIRMVKEGSDPKNPIFETPQESIKRYKEATSDQEKIDLLKRMNKTNSFALTWKKIPGEIKVEYSESLDFGLDKLQAVVSNLSNVTKVTGLRIIEDAQGMLEDLNKYFAGGLQEDTLADSARTKARRIDRKTKEISTKQT